MNYKSHFLTVNDVETNAGTAHSLEVNFQLQNEERGAAFKCRCSILDKKGFFPIRVVRSTMVLLVWKFLTVFKGSE